MLKPEHMDLLNLTLHSELRQEGRISDYRSESGGSINESYCFKYANQKYFLKHNSHKQFPLMFKKEVRGLTELGKCKSLVIPQPIADVVIENEQYLILSYLKPATEDALFFAKLGSALAELHKITSDVYGFEEDNYIGSLVQLNAKRRTWPEFFYELRLEPLIKWCYDQKYLSGLILQSFENLSVRFNEIFPDEKPALLHGDLWSGNKMNTSGGPAIFDPAVYYGHREMDIAMTRLFGGFQEDFYRFYNSQFPLEKDYQKRTDICNLYPLLVHVKLFGVSYLGDVITTIKRF